MCKKIFIVLAILISPGLSWAVDYKDWLPYLPDKMDELKVTAKDDGMNMNMGGMVMSTLSRTYGGGDKKIVISIVHQESGQQNISQQAMTQMSIETARRSSWVCKNDATGTTTVRN